jgi:hypothetical protein
MIKCRLVIKFRIGGRGKKMVSNIQSRVKFQCFCFHSGHHACYLMEIIALYSWYLKVRNTCICMDK